MANWVRYPLGGAPPPFLSVSPLESMRSGGAIPPPQKGYLSDTGAIPYENKASGCDTPLCDTISKGYCAIWGGTSHWAAKGRGALKQPIKQPTETPTSTLALMGRFPSLMGRFPTLMGRFTDFVLRGRFTSRKSTGKQPIKKRGIKRFLKKSLAISETLDCDLRVRWKVASNLRFRVAISEAETPSFFLRDLWRFGSVNAEIASDCAIVRFWCAK